MFSGNREAVSFFQIYPLDFSSSIWIHFICSEKETSDQNPYLHTTPSFDTPKKPSPFVFWQVLLSTLEGNCLHAWCIVQSHDWALFARTRWDRAPTAPANGCSGFGDWLPANAGVKCATQFFFPVFFTWPTEKWEEKSLSEQKQNGIKNSWMYILGEVQIFVFCTSDCLAKFLFKVPADSYWWLPFSRSHSGCKLQIHTKKRPRMACFFSLTLT